MKCHEIDQDERELINAIQDAEQRSSAEYISLIAMMLYFQGIEAERHGILWESLENAAREDLKRAITLLQDVRDRFSSPEDIDGTICFICREFLHEEVA